MHPESHDTVANALRDVPMAGQRVLEFGSYDVNGGVQDVIAGCAQYVGVDWRRGPGVSHVSLFHEFYMPQLFDIFLCLNTLEHDPYWKQSIANGVRHLSPGGLAILTVPHGYPEHEMEAPPVAGHYANIHPDELQAVLAENGLSGEVRVLYEPPETHVVMRKA